MNLRTSKYIVQETKSINGMSQAIIVIGDKKFYLFLHAKLYSLAHTTQ